MDAVLITRSSVRLPRISLRFSGAENGTPGSAASLSARLPARVLDQCSSRLVSREVLGSRTECVYTSRRRTSSTPGGHEWPSGPAPSYSGAGLP
ncbi:MAG: hypothetical protein KGJ23_03755 [Euryarchaeota archaeon]|nr:hypothetical protein [Euryarchaeota archaeon]MDE1835716.1 hypothetical protein [Euryarchaeota archaeon]MDE1880860.1 hypothetical protein [Euryarchaeota archaeon]MDE2043906.1 hypothetical protein [Thermoplasmata archaeon]